MYEYNAYVDSVHDGDTFHAKIDLGFTVWTEADIRFLGINCPELGTVTAPILTGEAATQAVLNQLGRDNFAATRTRGYFGKFGDYLALPGRAVKVRLQTRLTSAKDTEKYGRVLATVFLADNSNLNQWLLDNGFAVPMAMLAAS